MRISVPMSSLQSSGATTGMSKRKVLPQIPEGTEALKETEEDVDDPCKEEDEITECRVGTWLLFMAVYGVTTVLLVLLWVFGWIRAGNDEVTFSEIIATDPLVMQLFVAWLVAYIVLSILLLVPFFYEPIWKEPNQHARDKCMVNAIRGFIFFFTFTKFLGLIFLTIFPVTTHKEPHYVFTGIAFLSAILLSILRLIHRRQLFNFDCEGDDFHRWQRCLLWVNLLYVFFEIGIAIAFVVTLIGSWEFLLTVLVMVSRAFDVEEFRRNTMDVKFIRKIWVHKHTRV